METLRTVSEKDICGKFYYTLKEAVDFYIAAEADVYITANQIF